MKFLKTIFVKKLANNHFGVMSKLLQDLHKAYFSRTKISMVQGPVLKNALRRSSKFELLSAVLNLTPAPQV
jgi:hypothetical protein